MLGKSEERLKKELQGRLDAANKDGFTQQKNVNPFIKHAIGFLVFSGLSFLASGKYNFTAHITLPIYGVLIVCKYTVT
jgi:hypothetical protein